nr:putative protein N(5)-glutamine methyltransferase [Lysinibacter cavernae]
MRAAGCVYAEDEAALLMEAAASDDALDHLIRQRMAGLPLEPLLGWAAFDGHRVRLGPGVFVPRRRTELLLREASREVVEILVRRSSPAASAKHVAADHDTEALVTVIDVCSGSGAIAAALLRRHPNVRMLAVDNDPVAVEWAKRNVEPLGGWVGEGDLFDAIPLQIRNEIHGSVAIITANAPYVPTDEIRLMPPEARLHEPHSTLDGGPDGLALQRRIIGEAATWLAPGGILLVETSARQAPETLEMMRAGGLSPSVLRDESLEATAVIGRRLG